MNPNDTLAPAVADNTGRACNYYCVYCMKQLPVDEMGAVIHDDVYHPETATYDEQDRPQ